MKTVALFGAKGFVGSEILKALKSQYTVFEITRENFQQHLGKDFDYVINAAMPAARFRAANDPEWDKRETVEKTRMLYSQVKFKKFIQVSSVSARCQLDTVYGKNKAAAESIIDSKANLIVRLGPMFGSNLKKGVLIDMLQGNKVFVSGETRYAFAPVEFVGGWIAKNLDRKGISEVGAKNSLRLKDLAEELGLKVEFEGPVDHQEMQGVENDFPDVKLVIGFMQDKMRNL